MMNKAHTSSQLPVFGPISYEKGVSPLVQSMMISDLKVFSLDTSFTEVSGVELPTLACD